MKKKKKILIISLIIIALIAFTVYEAYIYFKAFESVNAGAVIKGSKTLSINLNSKRRYVFIELKADASLSGKSVKYYIINPSGTILDKGEFSKDSSLNISRRYSGIKGTWHIKFEAPDADETIEYNYLFASANRKNAISYYQNENIHFQPVP